MFRFCRVKNMEDFSSYQNLLLLLSVFISAFYVKRFCVPKNVMLLQKVEAILLYSEFPMMSNFDQKRHIATKWCSKISTTGMQNKFFQLQKQHCTGV